MDAYDQPTGSSPILVGNAWVNNYRHQEVGGISEAVNDFTGVACPTVAQFEWFGTVSGTTQVTAASALNYYNGFTKLWVRWPTSYTPYRESPYSMTNLGQGGFKTWG
jgi:hypothetical protein